MSDDGGPAFPRSGYVHQWENERKGYTEEEVVPGHSGMSLRAWLTGKALEGIGHLGPWDDLGSYAVKVADDAIKALQEKPSE